ncbi:MAG: Cyclohexanone monooxygenase, partial [uncultured Acetobacteraceae bacterium]
CPPGTSEPTSRASRVCSCPTWLGWISTAKSATRSPRKATRASCWKAA